MQVSVLSQRYTAAKCFDDLTASYQRVLYSQGMETGLASLVGSQRFVCKRSRDRPSRQSHLYMENLVPFPLI